MNKKNIIIYLSLFCAALLTGCTIPSTGNKDIDNVVNTVAETGSSLIQAETGAYSSLFEGENSENTTKSDTYDSENDYYEVHVDRTGGIQGQYAVLYPVSLVRVVDGDTLIVRENDQEYKVRLIGIDTPESVNPDESKNTEFGKLASEHTKELLKDTTELWLEFDEDEFDDYGRTLAYVWTSPDDSTYENMLNVQILVDGYANAMSIEPNTKYKTDFEAIALTVKISGSGLWSDPEFVKYSIGM